MKTIVIYAAYIKPHLGGIETYMDNLVKELSKFNYKIVIVTTNFNNSSNFESINNIDIIRLPIHNIFKNRYPIIKKNNEAKFLLSKLKKYDISAIIVNTRFHLTSHLGAKYGKKNHIPVLLIEHGSSYITVNNMILDKFANIYERFLTRRIKKKVNGFYGVSRRCNEWLKKLSIDASGVFYNAIDETIFDKNKKYIKNNKKIIITYAGRILVEKGVVNLLEAFKELKEKDNCILKIAGDGPILEELKTKYKAKNIEFLGRIDHDEVIKLCAQTDIFVYPSMYPEGLPTSILEAGIMKCAVVATDRGGTKEVINNKKYGIIVEENVEDLIKQLEYLVENPKIMNNMKENIHDRVMKDFVWSRTAKEVVKEIRKYDK